VGVLLYQGAPYWCVTVLPAQPLNFLSLDEVELRLAAPILITQIFCPAQRYKYLRRVKFKYLYLRPFLPYLTQTWRDELSSVSDLFCVCQTPVSNLGRYIVQTGWGVYSVYQGKLVFNPYPANVDNVVSSNNASKWNVGFNSAFKGLSRPRPLPLTPFLQSFHSV